MLSTNFLLLLVVGAVVADKISLVRESLDEDHQLEYDHTKLKNKAIVGVETGNKERFGYVDAEGTRSGGKGQPAQGSSSNGRFGGGGGGSTGGGASGGQNGGSGKVKVEAIKLEKDQIARVAANSDVDFEDEHIKKRDRTSHKKEEFMKDTESPAKPAEAMTNRR